MSSKVQNLYAWIAEGEMSFCATKVGDGWFPLVFANMSVAQKSRPLADRVAAESGKTLHLVRFTYVSIMETVEP